MAGILGRLYAWILPIKIDLIDDMGLFFMLTWWDGYKLEWYDKMQKIMPAYRNIEKPYERYILMLCRGMSVTEAVANAVFKRADFKCEICGLHGFRNDPLQLHHVLLHRSAKHPKYDHEYNLQVVHKSEHDTKANTRDNEVAHYRRVCEYYGREKVEDWITSLNLKTREYW